MLGIPVGIPSQLRNVKHSVRTMECRAFHTFAGNSFLLSQEFPENEGMKFLRFLGKVKDFSVGC